MSDTAVATDLKGGTRFTPNELCRQAPFYVAGHRGLVGGAIWRKLSDEGFSNLHGRSSKERDLKDRAGLCAFFEETKPKYVVLAAAKVGGTLANSTYPVEFLSENLRIQSNVMDAALKYETERLLFLGSSCIYPKFAEQPIREDSLLTGRLDEANDDYAIAKIAGILNVQAVRREYGLPWVSAMPTNLYRPGDNFSPTGSHVLPVLIRRYDEATASGAPPVTNWGTGTPRREFLHVDDMADACLHLMQHYDGPGQVNVVTGSDVTIRKIAETVSNVIGFRGATDWDATKPDDTPQKLLDVSKLTDAGWTARLSLADGVARTIEWFRRQRDKIRGSKRLRRQAAVGTLGSASGDSPEVNPVRCG